MNRGARKTTPAAGGRFLIVKTSSLGDIIQAFGVLNDLRRKFPLASIDWVVEKRFLPIVAAHPLVRNAISIDIKPFKTRLCNPMFWSSLWKALLKLREQHYDAVFDLQGNCKSGLVTFLSRSREKVGFGIQSVREWPNIIATRTRFEIPRSINIRLQYKALIQRFFNDSSPSAVDGVRFKMNSEEQGRLSVLLSSKEFFHKKRIMVCPGSKWINKQLPLDALAGFLGQIEAALHCSFLLVWGTEEEKKMCEHLKRRFSHCSCIVDRLDVPLWQNLMCESDLVIAMDSGALHLCGTTSTPSFSIFGPTSPKIFKPEGASHLAFQGSCPYRKTFDKQCPQLRNCPTGACIRDISANELFGRFWAWWQKLNHHSSL